jgi:hypothetical protein
LSEIFTEVPGYQGAAAHTFTTGCDGFHPIGEQCNLAPGGQPDDEYRLTAAGQARADTGAAGMRDLYREALERLADPDTPVLGEGLGGGAQEELHFRASLAAHTLGRDTCGCTACLVSLGLDPEGDDFDEDAQRAADLRAHAGGMGGPSPARVTDAAAGILDDGVCPDCGMRHKFAEPGQ